MDLTAVPYLIVSRRVEDLKVFVCLCLIDHLVVGVGLNRDQALAAMIAELNARHGDQWENGDLDASDFTRN